MGKQKIVSQLGPDGYLVGPTMADESPLEPGVFLIPGGAIEKPLPEKMEPGKAYRLSDNGEDWIAEEDHRGDTLYRISDGWRHHFGPQLGDHAYSGIGPVPSWLTTQPRPDAWSVWKNGAWVRDEAAWQTEIQTRNQAEKERRLAQATQRIAILQDAVDLEMVTDAEKAALPAWRRYRVEVSRIVVSQEPAQWPEPPQDPDA